MFLKIVGRFQLTSAEQEQPITEQEQEQEQEEQKTSTSTTTTTEQKKTSWSTTSLPSIYTLSVSTSVDQIFEYFPGKEILEVREELIEATQEDILELKFTNNEIEYGTMKIPIEDIYSKESWLFTASGVKLLISITIVERVPKNWVDTGLELLGSQRPWYFKAEDIYSLIKHILNEFKITTSSPVVELCRLVDYATLSVGKNLLSLRLDEGFSLVSQIDDVLDSLLASIDKNVDSKLLQLVLSLQQLRKNITRRIRELSFFAQEKLYMLKAQTSLYAETASQGLGTLDRVYVWALESTENTTNQVKNNIFQHLQSLREAGRASIAAVQSHIYSRIIEHVTSYQQSLLNITAIAHPYILGAVATTQPYINNALVTATPLIQTIREKTPVETWIHGTKEALERHQTVGPYVVAATQVIEEVKNYCTDQQYFEHQTSTSSTAAAATTSNTTEPIEVIARTVAEN